MKNFQILLIISLAVFSVNPVIKIKAQDNNTEVSLKKVWESPDILTTSESVCYDAGRHVMYVSCINGNPVEKDKNGFIAMLSESGEIITLKWVDGLNAPKGMAIQGRKLYITDIDRVVAIDIENSTISREFPFEGAKFLNDITIDLKGAVYISDMATGKIHRINRGFTETWLEDESLINPNGLLYENEKILIGTKDGIFSVGVEDKKTVHLVKDTGGIDGLKADGKGNYIISDWKGKIQLVNPKSAPVVLLNTTDSDINAADFEFIPKLNLLVVPTFSDNRIMAYELINKKEKE
ncbi:MAG: hypothetical protein B6D61_12485 [Bacteroidetes bacterium 4484_249]|nr:MAG: hypothetical protein B6D61_12485 [Bacteroidetes bacterium 4484_249]